MGQDLPFFNFSLKKLLASESSTFQRSKIKIVYTFLIFAILKSIIVIFIAGYHQQIFQMERAFIILLVYIVFLKLLLANSKYLKTIAHLMIFIGLLLNWSMIYLSDQSVNTPLLQVIF